MNPILRPGNKRRSSEYCGRELTRRPAVRPKNAAEAAAEGVKSSRENRGEKWRYLIMSSNQRAADNSRIDWMITLVPFILIMGLAVYLFIYPEQANVVISQVRFFFGDTVGLYYLVIGLGVLIVSIFLSVSRYISCSTPLRSGLCTPRTRTSRRWAPLPSGQAFSRCFIGVLSPGLFIWCSRLRSASCCTCASAPDRDTVKRAGL